MNKIFIPILIASTVIIGSCYLTYDQLFSPKAKAIKSIKLQLLDGDSVRFERLNYFSKSKHTCGLLNAKNKLGGYIGFKYFMLDADHILHLEPETAFEDDDIDERLHTAKLRLQFLETMQKHCPDV